MDRYTRLTMANKIYSHLLEMKYRMDVMVMMCKFDSWDEDYLDILNADSLSPDLLINLH